MSDDGSDPRREVRDLRADLAALDERLSSLERRLEERDETAGRDADADAGTRARDRPTTDERRDAARSDRAAAATTPADRDWERDVGVRWLGVVGVVALVVGVALFVRYAIQRDLLGYLARIVLGVFAGTGMVAAGRYAARFERYERWGTVVLGGGLAITYLSVYAAYGLDAYREAIGTSFGATLALLSLVVVAGAWLSVRDETRVVAAESFLLGYLTAVVAMEWGTFTLAYALVLTVALAAVAVDRGLPGLAVGGALGSYGVYALWWFGRDAGALVGGAYLVATFACLLAVALVPPRAARPGRFGWLSDLLTGLNALAFALSFDAVVRDAAVGARPYVLLALAVLFVGVAFASDRTRASPSAVAPYLAVAFYAAAVDVALPSFAVTVVLAATLPALVAASLRLERPRFRRAAHGLAAVLVAKVLLADARLPAASLDPETLLSPTRLYAFLAVVAACYLTALALDRWYARAVDPESDERGSTVAVPAYAWLGTALAVIVLALELSSYPLSAVWAGYALALLAVGLAVGVRTLRLQAVALLGVTTFKVFVVDTSGLDPLARTLSFLTLGVVLLVAAFAYARQAGRLPDAVE